VDDWAIREQFFRTRDPLAALGARTARIDDVVREYWQAMPAGFALVAVGGYGRGEMFPASDVDLLILSPSAAAQDLAKEPLAHMLSGLWDQKLRISQSVHTTAECNRIEATNAELAVSLLDRRFLAGNESLFQAIRDPRPELGKDIAKLTHERHSQYQHTIYHLEPNVKDSPGGLRDLQVIRWLAKLVSGDSDIPQGHEVLFQIRCFLHYLAGRDDNKLTFERQDEIARLMEAESPEAMMRRFYRAIRGIARTAERRLDKFESRRGGLLAQFRDRTSKLSNADFSVVSGEVYLRNPAALEDRRLVLDLFDFVSQHGLPLAADTEERLEQRTIDSAEWVDAPGAVWGAFRKITLGPHAAMALRAMHSTGVLESIFPELRSIEALVIRDFYHRYTVDEHTLVAIRNVLALRELKDGAFRDLARETPDIDLLVTALLFHDVGKGSPGESHVAASRRIAEGALTRLGVSERARGVVTFLIEAHLEMSLAMSGRDLTDPAVIRSVAERTGTVERLKLLTLVTWGDISAVHPDAMTVWRKGLLWNLYTSTHTELTRELTDRTHDPGSWTPAQERFLNGLPPRYLRVHSPEEVQEHLYLEAASLATGIAVALTRHSEWVLTVVGKDRPFLFASIAAAISSFGFNILRAEAFSNTHGTVVDTFAFADPGRMLELTSSETERLIRTVTRAARGEVTPAELLRRRPRVKPDAVALSRAQVRYDNQTSTTSTLIHLVAQDRPGLLYDVASVISERGCNIEVVLVDTEAKKAIDVFYVTRRGLKLDDEGASALCDAMRHLTAPPG
jgi:[protein-PII] uridylyltransferase